MVSRALRVLATLLLLSAGYLGYAQGYALVLRWVGRPQSVMLIQSDPMPSKTEQEALLLAARAFGARHWTADRNQRTCYYDAHRGFWFFFKEYARTNGGKQIRFAPFALICQTKGKDNLNTVMANEAYVDFDRAFDLSPTGGPPPRIVHAKIEGEVNIRDDQGTFGKVDDDLTIGPLTHIEYSEAEHKVHTTSKVELREKDLAMNATGLTIELRPAPAVAGRPTSYLGAKTVWLLKDISITVRDVGRTGLVPGAPASDRPRPGNLTAQGPARIDLPEPRAKDAPAGPARPIVAQFFQNVRLRQGDYERPDQCDADTLRLTLYPEDEPEPKAGGPAVKEAAVAATKAAPIAPDKAPPGKVAKPAEPGRLAGMVLRLAEATGHAVWLQSPMEGLRARGNELRYERNMPKAPDRIFFRGDKLTWIEKETLAKDGPNAGQLQSVDTIRTKDVTIIQGPKPGEQPTVIARGPGRMETRTAREAPYNNAASWSDQLELEVVETKVGPRRRITILGSPKLESPKQGTLTATESIVAFLKEADGESSAAEAPVDARVSPTALARGETPPPAGLALGQAEAGSDAEGQAGGVAPSQGGVSAAGKAFQIDWMEARGTVEMKAVPPAPADGKPPGPAQDLLARNKLNIVFTTPPATASSAPAIVGDTPPAAPAVDAAPSPGEAGGAPIAASEQPAAAAAGDPSGDPQRPVARATTPGPVANNPALRVEADEVWAKIRLAGPATRPQVEEVQLLRKVTLHQDAEPGKARGTDASGDVMVYVNRGVDQAWLEAQGTLDSPARVVTDTLSIEGPRLIVDQAGDFAQVVGPGKLRQDPTEPVQIAVQQTGYQEPEGAAGSGPEAGAAAGPMAKLGSGPSEIRWIKEMRLYGQPSDPAGRPIPAYAVFEGRVRGWFGQPKENAEATLKCDRMRATLDAPIAFRGGRRAKLEDGSAAPRPRIVLVHCLDGVNLLNRKRDARTGQVVQQGQVDGPELWYHVVTGQFLGKGPGVLRYLAPQDDEQAERMFQTTSQSRRDDAVRQTLQANGAVPAQPAMPSGNLPDPARVASSTSVPRGSAPARTSPIPDPAAGGAERVAAAPELRLTKVSFRKKVEGRIAAEQAAAENTPFHAQFEGGVQVIHGAVASERVDLSVDNPPLDFVFVSAETIEVIREASPAPSELVAQAPPAQFFIDARGGRPMGRDAQKAIFGDRITYDSVKQLVYVYGEENGVTIANQDTAGQPISVSRGRAVMYNRRDGQVRYIEPQNILIVDPRSGIRSRPIPPGQPRDVKPPKRMAPPRRVLPNDRERRGFNGR